MFLMSLLLLSGWIAVESSITLMGVDFMDPVISHIYMSGDGIFNYHISSLSKKCANLSGWILRTFYTRDCITMLTLFKSIVVSRLDYGSQLWSPFLIKYITQLEKIQRSFTQHITGMNDMPYHER